MIVQPKVLWGPVQLVLSGGVPSALLYTAPLTNSPVLIKNVVVCNINAGAQTYSFYIVRSGLSLTNANALVLLRPIAVDESQTPPELAGLVLNPGDTIWSNASLASAVNCVGSGWGV